MASAGVLKRSLDTANPQGLAGMTHSIGIAEIRVVHAPDRIRTVLGSCIGVAVFDRATRLGGMAHVILPDSGDGSGEPGKFADTAVDMLIEQLLSEGALKARLAAKIAGGAAMFGEDTPDSLGRRNAAAVEARLRRNSLPLMASAIGGRKGRRMILDPATGDVQVEVIGETAQVL